MTCKLNADTSDGLKIVSDTSGEIDLQIDGTTKVHMDSGGQIGIGTTSPSGSLHINTSSANILIADTDDSSGSYSRVRSDSSGSLHLEADVGNNTGSSTMRFSMDGSEKMRMDSDGDVGIGTTSPTGRFTVKQTGFGATNTLFDSSHSSTPQGVVIDFSAASPDNTSVDFLRCRDSSADRLIIFADGDIDNHDNSYSGFSDERMKEQITDSGSQWDDIKNIRVRKFKFKQDVSQKGDSDDLIRLGVIAQELESSGMSGLVSTKPEIKWTEEDELPVDDNGNPTVSVGDVKSEEIKSVKYSILYMKSVKALQEAMIRIETLEAKVTALEHN